MFKTKGKYPQIRKDIIISKLGEELMLYDPKRERLHVLNQTASLVWNMSNGQHSPQEIVQNIRHLFAVSLETPVESDVSKILAKLSQNGLLKN